MDSTHLEAYILRPTVHSINDSSIMAYHTELLHLDDVGLQSHIAKLGPRYSIIDAVAELFPDQLRIVQERTKAHQGGLVSVQYGKEVDMLTQMGTFKVKSMVFVIKTAAEKEKGKGPFGSRYQVPFQKTCSFPGSTTVATKNTGGGLFGGSKSLFPPPAAASSTGSNLFGCKPQLSDATLHSGNVLANGHVFYREKDSTYGVQEYTSINFSQPYQDKSFEELRLADYKSGQTNKDAQKPGLNPIVIEIDASPGGGLLIGSAQPHPVNNTPETQKSTGLFGQKPISVASPFRGFFGTTKAPTPFFGGPSGGFGTAFAPSRTQVDVPPAPGARADSVLGLILCS